MQIRDYSEKKHAAAWDEFVLQANNGTLFHLRKFLNYHPEGRFQDNSLLFRENNRLLAVFPAVLRRKAGETVLVSHCGASYGGIVHREELSIASAFTIVELLLEYCAANRISRIELTAPPIIYQSRPSNYLDFALYKNGFGYKKREISSIIPLDFSQEDILNKYKPESRTAVRRAEKLGLSMRESDDFSTFYPILERNLGMRHQVKPTHTLGELLSLKALFPNEIRQFGAYLGDTLIAGVTCFICNPRVVLAFYISHDQQYQRYRPVNYLFYRIMQWCITKQYRFLDFGIFTVDEEPNWGLGKFKESLGARGIFRDTLSRDIR
ncbi:GNAT family N-acetyltransferase [bacterium]|nr:GNAT family N-acetyltransferase [bacterium]